MNSDKSQSHISPLIIPPTRLIGTNSKPNEASDYIEPLDIYFRQHKIYEKAEQLYNESDNMTDENGKEETVQPILDQLDQLITEVMLKSEKLHCSKKRPIMWSPEIMHSYMLINYWKLEIKER